MHEYSVASGIIETVLPKAENRRLEKISLSIGAFSGVSKESLLMYLESIFAEKKLPFPQIQVAETPARCKCECGKEYETFRFLDGCPTCGKFIREILGGMDCVIDSIEVSDT